MPMHIFFTDDGAMEKRVFLATWKDIPSQNEVQFSIENINMNAGMFINLVSQYTFVIISMNAFIKVNAGAVSFIVKFLFMD